MLPWIRQYLGTKKTVIISTVCLVTGFFVCTIVLPQALHAQTAPAADTFGIAPVEDATVLSTDTDIRIIIARIIRAALGLLGIIFVVLTIYAGYLIMTSGGDEEKVAQGKQYLRNGVVGLIIIFASLEFVKFVLRALSDATARGDGVGGGGRAPRLESFRGSGSLGRAIRDHYPFRDETDVRRNTRIAVTFREAIDPASVIADTNGNGLIGDCATPAGQIFNWEADCDRINTEAIRIFRRDTPDALLPAAGLATREGDDSAVYTLVMKPLDPPLHLLGSPTTTVEYVVDLTEEIMRADGEISIFANTRDGHYAWEFTTATTLDATPPAVERTYPRHTETVARNSIIQINFSEPMDPTAVQGSSDRFFHIVFGTSTNANALPSGEWNISNGYRTVEFVPDAACGQNSCGDTMYCLALDCANAASGAACQNTFTVLLRAAQVTGGASPTSFEAVPFSGVMDLAGNALDSGPADTRRSPSGIIPPDGTHGDPNRPPARILSTIGPGERAPDNFWWDFTVENRIDRTAPYIVRVSPGIDEEDVDEDAPLTVAFSHLIWSGTLRDVALEEYPASVNDVDPIWYSPRSRIEGDVDPSTVLELRHRAFGPNDADLYYFPSIPSTVRSVSQNCLYPGRGPSSSGRNTSPACVYEEREDGTIATDANCVNVTIDSATDTGCLQTSLQRENDANLLTQPNIAECLNIMRRPDISSVSP